MGEGIALNAGGEELQAVDLPAAAAADGYGERGDDGGLDSGAELGLSGVERDKVGVDFDGLVGFTGR